MTLSLPIMYENDAGYYMVIKNNKWLLFPMLLMNSAFIMAHEGTDYLIHRHNTTFADAAGNLLTKLTSQLRETISDQGHITYTYDYERLKEVLYPENLFNRGIEKINGMIGTGEILRNAINATKTTVDIQERKRKND